MKKISERSLIKESGVGMSKGVGGGMNKGCGLGMSKRSNSNNLDEKGIYKNINSDTCFSFSGGYCTKYDFGNEENETDIAIETIEQMMDKNEQMKDDKHKIYITNKSLHLENIDDGYVIFNSQENIVYVLEDLEKHILEKFDGKTTLIEIILSLQNEFQVDKQELLDETYHFLYQLLNASILIQKII